MDRHRAHGSGSTGSGIIAIQGRLSVGRGSRSFIRHRLPALALAATALIGAASAAAAHPHVFVTAKEQVIFGSGGKVTGIRAAWTFDDMYSSFLVQGLGDPGKVLTDAELAPLAKTNVESLADFGYFTVAKTAGRQLDFDAPTDYLLHEGEDKLLTLYFTLPLKAPASAARVFSLSVYDPTYFVSFQMSDKDPISLVSAPSGCSSSVVKPRPLDAGDNQKLSEAFFANMSPGTDFGIKLASRAIIACP